MEFWNQYSQFADGIDWIKNYTNLMYMQLCTGYATNRDFEKARYYLEKLADSKEYESMKAMIANVESQQDSIRSFVDYMNNMLGTSEQQLLDLSLEDKEKNRAMFLIGTHAVVSALCIAPDDGTAKRSEIREVLYKYLDFVSQFDCIKATNDAVLALASVLMSIGDFEIADQNTEKATELYQKSLELGKTCFERYSSEEPLKTVILSTTALDRLRGGGRLDREAWMYVDKCYNTIFSENYDRIKNFDIADIYYSSMIMVYEQENDLIKAKDYAKAREYLSFIKFKELDGLDNLLSFFDNIYASCQYRYRTEEYEKTDDYLASVVNECVNVITHVEDRKPTKEQFEHFGALLCKCEFLQAAVYSELDREDESIEKLKLFLESAKVFRHCVDLEYEISLAEEILSSEDEDEEE